MVIHLGRKKTGILLALALLTGGISYGETPVYVLDDVVVTATRTENDPKDVPASVEVITSENLEKTGAENLRDGITALSNVTMTRKLRGGGHEVILRGMSTDKVLILVNGRRVANEADGAGLGNANALDCINIHSVDRIEIVKGPSSAIYGSEAMSGVINIITKVPEEMGFSTGISTSSDGTVNWYHGDSGKIGKFSASMDMRFNKDRRRNPPGDLWNNDYGTSQTYHVDGRYEFSDDHTLDFYIDAFSQNLTREGYEKERVTVPRAMVSAMWGMAHQTGPAPVVEGDKVSTGLGKLHYDQKNQGLSWHKKTNRHDWQVNVYRSRFAWESRMNTTISSIPSSPDPFSGRILSLFNGKGGYEFGRNTNRLYVLDGRDTMTLNDHHRLTFGGEYTANRVYGTNLGDGGDSRGTITENGITNSVSEKEIRTRAFYLQDEIHYGKWFIVPAIRLDEHSMFGHHWSPKLGLTYEADDSFRVKANFGRGFKAPTIPQLYYHFTLYAGPMDVTLLGNPDLKPETSKSWDLTFEKEWGRADTALTYFETSAKNLIQYKRISIRPYVAKSENVDQARFKGLEHHLRIRWDDHWSGSIQTTWLMKSRQKGEGGWRDLEQRSRLSQIYAITYDDGKEKGWTAMLWDELNYHYRVPLQGENTLLAGPEKTFHTLNLTLTRKINKNTKIYGSLQNIFDKEDMNCDLDGRYWSIGWEQRF